VMRSEAADEDMLAIADELAASISIEAALALDERLEAAIESLDEMSNRGRVVPELRVPPGPRSVAIPNRGGQVVTRPTSTVRTFR